jgi:hypothetical protein
MNIRNLEGDVKGAREIGVREEIHRSGGGISYGK